jgi:hypothetical protein
MPADGIGVPGFTVLPPFEIRNPRVTIKPTKYTLDLFIILYIIRDEFGARSRPRGCDGVSLQIAPAWGYYRRALTDAGRANAFGTVKREEGAVSRARGGEALRSNRSRANA